MSKGQAAEPNAAVNAALWQPWRMTAFDLPAMPDPIPEDEAATICAEPAPDPEAVREAARLAGWSEGQQQGYEQGHSEGYAAGLTQGTEVGRAEGHSEGYAAGLVEGQALAREHAEHLKALADELARSLRDLEEDVGQGLITLALDIARHVVGDTLAQHPEALIHSVRQVMQADPAAAAPLRLWVHPDDLALVNGYLADELNDSDWHVLSDATLSRGGCRAETAFGAIDATLETRWRRVSASLGRASDWERKA